VSLPKPSALADCHNQTFSPSLVLKPKRWNLLQLTALTEKSDNIVNVMMVTAVISDEELQYARDNIKSLIQTKIFYTNFLVRVVITFYAAYD